MKIVECKSCGAEVTKTTGRYNESIKNGWNFFCSIACQYVFQEKGLKVSCAQCSKVIRKTPAQFRQVKDNVFCSKSCAASYNNRHKAHGTRRSKLEAFIEQRLREEFFDLALQFNTTAPLGIELDFYFPELHLAIEFNGIVHYQPIYGAEKLQRIQAHDQQKTFRCQAAKIELHVIDASRDSHMTKVVKERYWKMVKELVTSVKRRAGHTNAQVP